MRRDNLGELDVDGETILKWVLQQYDVRLQEKFISHKKGSSCKILKFFKEEDFAGQLSDFQNPNLVPLLVIFAV